MTASIDTGGGDDPAPAPLEQARRASMPSAVRAALTLCMAGAMALPAGPGAAHTALYRDGGVLLGLATDGVLLASVAILLATAVTAALHLIQSCLDPLWAHADATSHRNGPNP